MSHLSWQVVPPFYKVLFSRGQSREDVDKLLSCLDEFEGVVKQYASPFLGGKLACNIWYLLLFTATNKRILCQVHQLNVLLNYIYSTTVYFIAYDFLCTKICNKRILNIAFLLWLSQTISKTEYAFISVQVKSQWWWISTFGHTLCESLSCFIAWRRMWR